MLKTFVFTLLAGTAIAAPACAQDYGQYPAPSRVGPVPRSILTGDCALVAPYGPMPVRIYTTPQIGPLYNVPPYRVIAPY